MTSPLRAHWTLDPAITFLNHGSFGACPRVVLEVQAELRARLEAEPLRFFMRELEPMFDAAREAVADFIDADASDLVFVPNATHGVASVLHALTLAPGDEVLTTSLAYNACRNALGRKAERSGARVVDVPIPFPLPAELRTADALAEPILAHVTPRTRLALFDHVTSSTALILPMERLIPELEARGVRVLVDGAHAPGMIPLSVRTLNPSYYTGNLHKWVCAPKGAGFLWVRRDRHAEQIPLATSHGLNSPRLDRSRFWLEHDWTGTDDPTAHLSVPAALQFMGSLYPGGWAQLRAENHQKAVAAQGILCRALELPAPAPPELLGSMATVPLPDAPADEVKRSPTTEPLGDRLLFEDAIEVPVSPWPRRPARTLRVAMQAYNSLAEVERLAHALVAQLARERSGPA